MKAKPNRYRKLFLSEAWQHYWSVLFPGGVDWRADLESEIRKRLYFPSETSGFPGGDEPERVAPSWAEDLEIGFGDGFVEIKFGGAGFGKVPFFTIGPLMVMRNWTGKNPLEAAGDRSELTAFELEKCRDFCIAAVRDCGNIVCNCLLRMVKETVQPTFEIYCRPGGDVFSTAKKLPVSGLSEITGIDVMKNALTDRLGRPVLGKVQIIRRQTSDTKAGPHGSLQELDAPLVEEMKRLIVLSTARN